MKLGKAARATYITALGLMVSLSAGFLLACGLLMLNGQNAFADDVATLQTGNQERVDDEMTDDTASAALRDSEGRVSVLNTDKANPYKGQYRLVIDVGAEFSDYTVSGDSEGYLVKCSAGSVLRLPVVKALPGYTFIGWCQGGVPEEPQWDVMIRDVEISEDIGLEARIYAIYADDAGNGYCTCGAYKEGIYKDRLDEFKDKYQQYLSAYSSPFDMGSIFVLVAVAVTLFLLMFLAFIGTRKDASKRTSLVSGPHDRGTKKPIETGAEKKAGKPDEVPAEPEEELLGGTETEDVRYNPDKDPLDIMLG